MMSSNTATFRFPTHGCYCKRSPRLAGNAVSLELCFGNCVKRTAFWKIFTKIAAFVKLHDMHSFFHFRCVRKYMEEKWEEC